MKQLTIISGKGGTGKTTVAAAFMALAEEAVLVDADVDAPNLHLITHPEIMAEEDITGGEVARINDDKCIQCGKCEIACPFYAIDEFWINPLFCRGCAVCPLVCPVDAIDLLPKTLGKMLVSRTAYGPFVHPRMNIGESGTGKFITALRNKAIQMTQEENRELILIDGSPGIGCSMIASITGADGVLAVTEPTRSGMHDLERALDVTVHFHIPAWVCVNKADLYERYTAQIADIVQGRGIEVVGGIPYDPEVSRAMAQGIPVLESGCTSVIEGIRAVWQKVSDGLFRDSALEKEGFFH